MNDPGPATLTAPSRAPAHVRRPVNPLGVLGMALLVAVLVAPIPTHTWQATLVTALIGLVVVVLAASGRPDRAGRRSGVTLRSAAPWIALSVAVVALELGALMYDSRPDFPTISYLIGPEFVDATVRLVGYVAWICGGCWLVRR